MAILPRLLLLLALSICVSQAGLAFSPDRSLNPRVLVIVEDLAIKSSHSIFFKSLSDRGYNLEFKLASDASLALKRYGEYLYDGLVLFAPSVESFGGSVDNAKIVEFVDSGRDLILAADIGVSSTIRELATECGVDFDEEPKAAVIDHFNYAETKNKIHHTLIAADAFIDSNVILGDKPIQAPVLFEGVAHSVPPKNSLVIKVLTASSSAYSANPKTQLTNPPALTGKSISLVSVVQARNNARILISGSLSLFSNKYFKAPVKKYEDASYEKSGNEQFVTELSKWVFHERGHLKAVNVRHHKVGETSEPAMYRITDHLEYSLEMYEWTGKEWVPYLADDVQVQFYMMSPYVLKTMEHNGKGLYSTSFQVPDVYGVFQFKVEYNRLGYTSLTLAKQIPVRPFRHDEYERFIRAAYPYYSSCFSMMFGFFIFGIVFLYHK